MCRVSVDGTPRGQFGENRRLEAGATASLSALQNYEICHSERSEESVVSSLTLSPGSIALTEVARDSRLRCAP
jgi:hypothetical protein